MTRTWRFGQKVGAGFALVLLLTLTMGAVGFYALGAVVEGKNRVIQVTAQHLIDAERLRTAMHREVANVRAFLLTEQDVYVDEIRDANREFDAALNRMRERGLSAEAARLVAEVRAAEETHQHEVEQITEQRRSQDDLGVILSDFDERLIPTFDALADEVKVFVAASERELESGRQQASDTASRASSILVWVGTATLLVAVLVAWFLTRTLSRQIGESVQQVRSSSAELQAAASQQAAGAKEQATAMNEITTTIGELLATSRQIAESGQHVAKMASDSALSVRAGEQAVDKTRNAVGSIKEQVDAIVQHMLDLGKKSQQVGGILDIINELAEQTNILAINATIEASGAGDAGRRFAVVGEEIRKLADRVGGSTKEVRTLIEEIRGAVNATVMATEAGSKTVEVGTKRFQELQSVFSRIGELVASTMEAGQEIELSTKQQSTAVEQVNVAIANASQATQETEASSTQTLQTASQLASLSDDLVRLVQPHQTAA